MEYRKYDKDYLIRLDPGEEVAASLTELCDKEGIETASVTGIGAADRVEIGIFDPQKKEYFGRNYEGAYEIASLTGNITRQEGAPYLHLHIVIGNVVTGECHGGHMKSAQISATGELVVSVIDGAAGRRFSEKIGLNLIKFGEQ